jgi:hypothetical protein
MFNKNLNYPSLLLSLPLYIHLDTMNAHKPIELINDVIKLINNVECSSWADMVSRSANNSLTGY